MLGGNGLLSEWKGNLVGNGTVESAKGRQYRQELAKRKDFREGKSRVLRIATSDLLIIGVRRLYEI